MKSIQLIFTRAATRKSHVSTFWLLFWALVIFDDSERREKQRRKKRERQAAQQPRPKPPGF